jgi:hypothetical protein
MEKSQEPKSQEPTSVENKSNDDKGRKKPGPKPKEKFFRVRFHVKSNPNDQENVELSVNGETRVIERNKEVVLPERFLECAKHSTYPVFRQLPGKSRKQVGEVQKYPHDVIKEATEAEYKKMLAEGTKATKEWVEKHGLEDDE